MKNLLPVILFAVSAAYSNDYAREIYLPQGTHKVLDLPSMAKVAVSDTKILKVKTLSADELMITGLVAGQTVVQVWYADKTSLPSESFLVRVVGKETAGTQPVVKVSFHFLEVSDSLRESFGISWPEVFQFSGSGNFFGTQNTSGLSYSGSLQSGLGFLNQMVQQGWASLLASPELYVRLGEQASFHSGGEIPISTTRGSYGNNFQHIEWKPTGITVKVTPKSSDGISIQSDIDINVSETDSGSSEIPAITRRVLNTKMNSKDGETVLLSGLLRKKSWHSDSGTPFLSSIPLLGTLFKTQNKENRNTELVMAITFSWSQIESAKNKMRSLKERISSEQ